MIGATSGAGTAYPSGAPEFTPIFSGVCVTRSLVLMCMFCRSLFVFFFWPLCCLSLDLRILITSLISSHSSYTCNSAFYMQLGIPKSEQESKKNNYR